MPPFRSWMIVFSVAIYRRPWFQILGAMYKNKVFIILPYFCEVVFMLSELEFTEELIYVSGGSIRIVK